DPRVGILEPGTGLLGYEGKGMEPRRGRRRRHTCRIPDAAEIHSSSRLWTRKLLSKYGENPPIGGRTHMARFVWSILGLTIVLFLSSCATTTVSLQETKNRAYSEPLTKLFVEVNVGDWKCS